MAAGRRVVFVKSLFPRIKITGDEEVADVVAFPASALSKSIAEVEVPLPSLIVVLKLSDTSEPSGFVPEFCEPEVCVPALLGFVGDVGCWNAFAGEFCVG